MIQFAEDRYHSQIKTLWKRAFGDTNEFIEFYFSNRHKNENMLIFLKDGAVAAMLTMFPLTIKSGEQTFVGRYIYAVATDEKYQRQGISTQLLNYAHQWMKENKEKVSVLVPQSKALFEYYRKRGFKTVFKIDTLDIHSDEMSKDFQNLECTPCDLKKFVRIRNAVFENSGLYAKWGEEDLNYIMRFAKFLGEDIFYFHNSEGEGYAFYEREENTIIIKEIALINLELQTALSALHGKLKAEQYQVRLPEKTGVAKAITRDFGMINWIADEPTQSGVPPYLALVLD